VSSNSVSFSRRPASAAEMLAAPQAETTPIAEKEGRGDSCMPPVAVPIGQAWYG